MKEGKGAQRVSGPKAVTEILVVPERLLQSADRLVVLVRQVALVGVALEQPRPLVHRDRVGEVKRPGVQGGGLADDARGGVEYAGGGLANIG